jgi:hypothetical protein
MPAWRRVAAGEKGGRRCWMAEDGVGGEETGERGKSEGGRKKCGKAVE